MTPFRSTIRWVLLALMASSAAAVAAQGVAVDKSEIAFTIKQMGVKFDGRFRKWKADVVLAPDALARSKATFDIDLRSIDVASEDSEAEARGPLWFDTAKFPVARFESTSFKNLGTDRFEVAGRLSIKGATRDVIVPITVRKSATGERIAESAFPLKRLDFRIGEGEWADPATVENDVIVRIRIVLQPAA